MPKNERKDVHFAASHALDLVKRASTLSRDYFGQNPMVAKKWARAVNAVQNAQEANVRAVGMARIMNEEER